MQMVADVPLGAFLSGGVDSSCIVAMMQSVSDRPVKTFTVAFQEQAYDEGRDAEAVAMHLGTDHTEICLSAADALDVIPDLPRFYDEPFADSSQIPTYLVSRLARTRVAVSLSGDGGDELFGGYTRYLWARSLSRKLGWPGGLRSAASTVLSSVSPKAWDRVAAGCNHAVPGRYRQINPGDKLHKLAAALLAGSPEELHGVLSTQWRHDEGVVIGSGPAATIDGSSPGFDQIEQQMMFRDMGGFLPNDILVKLDRASMAVSLETRIPMLDHRLVDMALRTPLELKIRDGKGKWLLRQVLYRYVPSRFIERPKAGFSIPLDAWLRGPLRPWAEELLSEDRLRREGYLRAGPIREKWHQHLSGKRNWQHHIWNVLMFQSWLEHNREQI